MNAPKLAIGDGAMAFWVALEEVYRGERLATMLVKRNDECAQLSAQAVLAKDQIRNPKYPVGGDQKRCEKAFDLFIKTYELKYLKAAPWL